MTPSMSRAKTRDLTQSGPIAPKEPLHLFIAEIPRDLANADLVPIVARGLPEAWAVVCERCNVQHREDLPFGARLVPAPLTVSGELGQVQGVVDDYPTRKVSYK